MLISGMMLLSACASSSHHDTDKKEVRPTSIIYSPNGEPLNGGPLGRPTCQEALHKWFSKVNTSHTGMLTHEEFVADATSQFNIMDLDKNGYLLPEELERYRLPFRQETAARSSLGNTSSSENSVPQEGHRHGGSASRHSGGKEQTADHDNGPEPDPVMSADLNNDFRVTYQEFMTQAESIFKKIDVEHKGVATDEQVVGYRCSKKVDEE